MPASTTNDMILTGNLTANPELDDVAGGHRAHDDISGVIAMQLSSLDAGDIVLLDKKGRIFHGAVEAIDGQQLKIQPIDRHNTWRTASAKEVIGIWRASKATRARQHDRDHGHSTDDGEAPAQLFA